MQIRKVAIRNFRGIKQADWDLPDNRFVCLVGPGDSTKTTLLDAIGLVLSPKWNVQFTDADFHSCNIDEPITLRVVVGDLPGHILRDDTHGYDLSGIHPTGELVHDPEDDAEPCLIVQLEVTETLEPVWSVVRPDSGDDGVAITSRGRERFGVFRVDDRVDAHLRWGRSSALTRLTAQSEGAGAAVVAAQRAARAAVFETPDSALHSAAASVTAAAGVIGSAFTNLRPGLDPTSSSSTNALLLHDEEIPLTGSGLGTRRLTSLAIQEAAIAEGAIVLVDEVEHGLEPHRLHNLLQHLKGRTGSDTGQVIVTTHAPLAVENLHAADLSVVRNTAGVATIRQVPSELDGMKGTLRAGPSAVLANRIVVCEGKTELGASRRLIQLWDQQRSAVGKPSHAAYGVCLSDGKGSTTAPIRARLLQELGYPTLLVMDNDDRAADTGVAAASAAGALIVRWQVGHAIEDEVVAALDLDGLADLLRLAADLKGEESILNAIKDRLGRETPIVGLDPAKWIDEAGSLAAIKLAIGGAAKGQKVVSNKKDESKAWFKLEESGELLGSFIMDHWAATEGSSLFDGLRQLYKFVYEEELA